MHENWLQLFAEGAEGGEGDGASAEAAKQEQGTARPTDAHWQQVNRIYDGILQEAESLRELFPDFDIRRELQDQRFAGMLRCGMDLQSAYQAVHASEILPAAMAFGAQYAKEQLASALAGPSRPGENGLSGGGAVRMGESISAMSRADYDRVCRMVERGERVSFG